MKRFAIVALVATLTLGAAGLLAAQATENVDTATFTRIRDEGLNRSQIMETMFWLTDRYGPRLTGSPGFERAGDWAVEQLQKWGVQNVKKERWQFGRGWQLQKFHATMVEPQVMPIIGVPKAWTRGTNGTFTADVVRVTIANEADAGKYKGQLRGKIVLTQPVRDVRMLDQGDGTVLRYADKDGKWLKEALETPPARAGLAAYFNLDNGTGMIRGIWMQSNTAVAPIFAAWSAPLKDLGVDIPGPRSVSQTDHTSFDSLGVPAFQFVQERYEYNARTHHTNMDFLDRVQPNDMKQIATVAACFAWQAANRDQMLPRKPAPAAGGGGR